MTRLTDETLMLYADGLLEPSDGERIARIVAHDADVRARLEAFRMTGGNLADLFDDYMRTPAPSLESNLSVPTELETARRDRQSARWRKASWFAYRDRQLSAVGSLLAASLALICGIGLGWLLGAETGSQIRMSDNLIRRDGARLVAESALRHVLETMPSGRRISTSQGREEGQVSIKMTFENERGDYCREYEISAAIARHVGVACRTGGHWIISYQALLPPAPSAGSGIVNEKTLPAPG